jgi:hypothetical protein
MIKNESPVESIYTSFSFADGTKSSLREIGPLKTAKIQCDKGVGYLTVLDKDKIHMWRGIVPICGIVSNSYVSVYPHTREVSYDGENLPQMVEEKFTPNSNTPQQSASTRCPIKYIVLILLVAVVCYLFFFRK